MDYPENVKAVGKYKSVEVSWKNMKNTEFYNLFYPRKRSGRYDKNRKYHDKQLYNIRAERECKICKIYLTVVNQLGEGATYLNEHSSRQT